jgi:hypothetical protein
MLAIRESKGSDRPDRLSGSRMGAYEPLPQLFGGFVGCVPIKRHQGCWYAGRLRDAGPPAVGVDRRDLNQVRTAGDGFFEATNGYVHG